MILSIIAAAIIIALAVLGAQMPDDSLKKSERVRKARSRRWLSYGLGALGFLVLAFQAFQEGQEKRELRYSIIGEGSLDIYIGPIKLESPPGYVISVINSGKHDLFDVVLNIQELQFSRERIPGRDMQMMKQVNVGHYELGTIHPQIFQMTKYRLNVPDAGADYQITFNDRSSQTWGELHCPRMGRRIACYSTMFARQPWVK